MGRNCLPLFFLGVRLGFLCSYEWDKKFATKHVLENTGLDDLIRLKKQAGRGRDLLDVEALEKIREFHEEQKPK